MCQMKDLYFFSLPLFFWACLRQATGAICAGFSRKSIFHLQLATENDNIRQMEKNMKNENSKPTQKKTYSRMPFGLKFVLMSILIALFAKELYAKEIYNVKVVEYFEQRIGETLLGYALVDENGDGVADTHIVILYMDQVPLYRRAANLLQPGNTVSYDDSKKLYERSMGTYEIKLQYLLEINGISMKTYFPNSRVEFPIEFARQERLSTQTPPPQSAEERRIAELEAELQRLKQGR